ncbi:MAG: hypothetical protein NTY67_00130 [Cyanobacteria bacterium]|nr:hypothetical protein [Cyanobacteriota bacterium]
MPAPLSLRIKERYVAKWADGLNQQVVADVVGISVRNVQRIDRGETGVPGREWPVGSALQCSPARPQRPR